MPITECKSHFYVVSFAIIDHLVINSRWTD
jgi:hypothetical protein